MGSFCLNVFCSLDYTTSGLVASWNTPQVGWLHQGIHHKWVGCIKEYVMTIFYSMLINNTLFKPTKGIRQRGPLSPYLFILSMNYFFFALCKIAKERKSSVDVRICPTTPIIPCRPGKRVVRFGFGSG